MYSVTSIRFISWLVYISIYGCLNFLLFTTFVVFVMFFLVLYAVFNVLATSVARCVSTSNGDGEIRTLDPLLARQVLSQLSYTPIRG